MQISPYSGVVSPHALVMTLTRDKSKFVVDITAVTDELREYAQGDQLNVRVVAVTGVWPRTVPGQYQSVECDDA